MPNSKQRLKKKYTVYVASSLVWRWTVELPSSREVYMDLSLWSSWHLHFAKTLYYLGTNYIGSVDTNWYITAKQYILESINQIKTHLSIQLRKEWTHRRLKTTLKMDTTLFLDTYLHQEYQALIEMLQWVVTISRAEICFATSSLSQFSAAPREGHLS